MGATTGPVVAMGAITIINRSVLNDQPWDMKIVVGTVIAGACFAGVERVSAKAATAMAWMALAAVCLSRVVPGTPSPVESLLKVWREI